ncbi:metallophosphoesterase [Candidatus Pacearchaeota archaeon]|nr:metallophosphoesterase [Candidatus Pacearchaeota archaeon]
MKRSLQLLGVITVFVTIFFLFHYYVFSTFADLFGFSKNRGFYGLILACVVAYPLAAFFERKKSTLFTRSFYFLSCLWMGALFIGVWLVLLFQIVSVFIGFSPFLSGSILMVLDIGLVLFGFINARHVRLREVVLSSRKLRKSLRIVQLSDIHLGTINLAPFLEKLVVRTNRLNPDIVVITGDLVDGSAPVSSTMLQSLNDIRAPVFYVIGNHEIYDGLEGVLRILRKTKVRVLRNEIVKHAGIQIAGVDFYEGTQEVISHIKRLKFSKYFFTLLLNHAPTGFPEAVRQGVDLELSGHTHGGQLFPFTLFVRLTYRYVRGLHSLQGSHIFISQGVGTWGPPLRLGTSSEMTLVTLNPC